MRQTKLEHDQHFSIWLLKEKWPNPKNTTANSLEALTRQHFPLEVALVSVFQPEPAAADLLWWPVAWKLLQARCSSSAWQILNMKRKQENRTRKKVEVGLVRHGLEAKCIIKLMIWQDHNRSLRVTRRKNSTINQATTHLQRSWKWPNKALKLDVDNQANASHPKWTHTSQQHAWRQWSFQKFEPITKQDEGQQQIRVRNRCSRLCG